ncbi:10494_t:CDS:2 [Diversispora eburnea]|uniref:10494_t:CDS:1 n=1 Tax=Diversispora eburnea TaxID=1213867 RepID=A0A9N9FG84_9GLOM|nr:10494_t:CDS:2 [Diversispora eburnea]
MTYVQCSDICDYWLTVPDKDDDDPFHFAWKFHNTFNENLAKAITPSSFLCIDKSMCQWMVQLDPVEPPEHANKKKFSEYSVTIVTMLLLTRLCSIVKEQLLQIHGYSTTNLKTEITRYIKEHDNVKFRRPAIFDEYNEY